MNDTTASPQPNVELPAAIPLREIWPVALFAGILLLAVMYLVAVEGSAISIGPGEFIHELMHDGRHVLTVPCH